MESTKEIINTDDLKQAQTLLRSHIMKYIVSMSLKCAVELGIPTTIHNHGKPITITELTSSLSLSPSKKLHMNRLMRILSHSGIFIQVQSTEPDEDAYSLTPLSNLLVYHNNNLNLSKLLLFMLHPFIVDPFHSMSTWFKINCDSAPFDTFHGIDFWAMTCKDENFHKVFNEGMASDTESLMGVLLREHGHIFDGIKSLVDVGGGTGSAAKSISKAFPNIRCLVLERPVVVNTVENEENSGVQFVAGDMFVHIPAADAVFLKWILHDWNNEECVKILKQCKESVLSNGGGKLVIIDQVTGTNESDEKLKEIQLCFDMMMMGVCGSGERDEQEWKKIFTDAGFKHYQITPLLGTSIIELYP